MSTENRFKLARTKHNQHGQQSVKEVASVTGITKSMIDDLESTVGKQRNVSYLKVKKLAEYYGVTSDYLLGLSDTPSIDKDIQTVHEITGLSKDAIHFLEGLKREKSLRAADVVAAINTVLSEKENDECFMFWDRLAKYLFTRPGGFTALFEYGEEKFESDEILYAFLARNNEFIQKTREKVMKERNAKNGKH